MWVVHACAQACSAVPRPSVGSPLWQCFSSADQLTFSCSLCAAHEASGHWAPGSHGRLHVVLWTLGKQGHLNVKGGAWRWEDPILGVVKQLQPVHGTTNPSPISRPSYLAAPDWPRLFWNSDFISGDLLRRAPVWLHGRPQVHQKTQNLIVETFLWCCPPLYKSKFTVRQLFQCL